MINFVSFFVVALYINEDGIKITMYTRCMFAFIYLTLIYKTHSLLIIIAMRKVPPVVYLYQPKKTRIEGAIYVANYNCILIIAMQIVPCIN